MMTGAIIKIDTYQYENPAWEDQLTSYNDTSVIYDKIENPINRFDSKGNKWYYFGLDKVVNFISSIFDYSIDKTYQNASKNTQKIKNQHLQLLLQKKKQQIRQL